MSTNLDASDVPGLKMDVTKHECGHCGYPMISLGDGSRGWCSRCGTLRIGDEFHQPAIIRRARAYWVATSSGGREDSSRFNLRSTGLDECLCKGPLADSIDAAVDAAREQNSD